MSKLPANLRKGSVAWQSPVAISAMGLVVTGVVVSLFVLTPSMSGVRLTQLNLSAVFLMVALWAGALVPIILSTLRGGRDRALRNVGVVAIGAGSALSASVPAWVAMEFALARHTAPASEIATRPWIVLLIGLVAVACGIVLVLATGREASATTRHP